MTLWLAREYAVHHPYAIDKLIVQAGLASSLTEARRLIASGSISLSNEKLVPPQEGFLPVLVVCEGTVQDYVALGIAAAQRERGGR